MKVVSNERFQRKEENLCIQEAQKGSRKAFERLAHRYSRNVYGLALVLTGNTEDAVEVAQEAMVKAFGKIKTFEFRAPFCSWLLSITKNTFRDHHRKEAQRRRKREAFEKEAVLDPVPNPEALVDRHGRVQAVHLALSKVPQPFRETVHLYDIQGLSYLEIADVFGVAMGTVKSRLKRGRDALRQELKKAGFVGATRRTRDGDDRPDGESNERGREK